MIIGVDVDDVVLDLVGEWIGLYNADHGDTLTIDDVKTWTISDVVKAECGTKIYDYLKHPTLYETMPPVEGAIEGVRALREMGHRVVFVTSCVRGVMFDAKWTRLIQLGFLSSKTRLEYDYIGATDKTLVNVSRMLDDKAETVNAFGLRGYLFKRPWNNGQWTWENFIDAVASGLITNGARNGF